MLAPQLSDVVAEINSHHKHVSGGAEVAQLASEVQITAKHKRQSLLEEMVKFPGNYKVTVSPKESLAMKTDLQIPWNKLRVMRR